jgi:hypothetical protein
MASMRCLFGVSPSLRSLRCSGNTNTTSLTARAFERLIGKGFAGNGVRYQTRGLWNLRVEAQRSGRSIDVEY